MLNLNNLESDPNVNKNGGIYIGQWLNDKQNGLGDEIFPDGSRYIGEYLNGNRNGKGKFTWKDGSYYEGDFETNKIQGNGIYRWRNGKVYYGNWFDNKMNGVGLFLWPDKKKYLGEYLKDKKNGVGIFIWPDGRKYLGKWKKGKQHGIGIFKSNNIIQYGEWDYGKRIKWIKQDYYEMDLLIFKFNNDFFYKIPKLIFDLIEKYSNEDMKIDMNNNNNPIDIELNQVNIRENIINIEKDSNKIIQREKNNSENSTKLNSGNFFDLIEYKLELIKERNEETIIKSDSEEKKSEKKIEDDIEDIRFKSYVKEIGKELNEYKIIEKENDIPYYIKTDFGDDSSNYNNLNRKKKKC